jgi:hypothetical protein
MANPACLSDSHFGGFAGPARTDYGQLGTRSPHKTRSVAEFGKSSTLGMVFRALLGRTVLRLKLQILFSK